MPSRLSCSGPRTPAGWLRSLEAHAQVSKRGKRALLSTQGAAA